MNVSRKLLMLGLHNLCLLDHLRSRKAFFSSGGGGGGGGGFKLFGFHSICFCISSLDGSFHLKIYLADTCQFHFGNALVKNVRMP